MKDPLHYQLSEYDCGRTSMLNAMSYLFKREEIHDLTTYDPDIEKGIFNSIHAVSCRYDALL